MKRIVSIFLALIIVPFFAAAQEISQPAEAFSKSYSLEGESKYEEAAEALKSSYDPASYEINLRLGWLSYLSGSYIESMNYYQSAITLKPFAIEPRFGYIAPASSAGNWNQVEEQYKSILGIDPMNTVANYWLGMIYYNREQYDQALKYFEKVVNLYPFDYDGTIMFAWTNLKMSNLREAKILFQKALLMRPGDSSATEGLNQIQ